MNMKFLTLILAIALGWGCAAQAEDIDDFGLDETIEAVEENVPEISETEVIVEENAVVADEPNKDEKVAENDAVQENKDNLSVYIKNLDLTDQQLVKAKEISYDGNLHRIQLMQSLERLQKQIEDMENKNLEDFQQILTPEQLSKFQQLRKNFEETRQIETLPELSKEKPVVE